MTDHTEVHKAFLQWRGIKPGEECVSCLGAGVRLAANPAHRLHGAAEPIHDVCQLFWGSGKAHERWTPWPSRMPPHFPGIGPTPDSDHEGKPSMSIEKAITAQAVMDELRRQGLSDQEILALFTDADFLLSLPKLMKNPLMPQCDDQGTIHLAPEGRQDTLCGAKTGSEEVQWSQDENGHACLDLCPKCDLAMKENLR